MGARLPERPARALAVSDILPRRCGVPGEKAVGMLWEGATLRIELQSVVPRDRPVDGVGEFAEAGLAEAMPQTLDDASDGRVGPDAPGPDIRQQFLVRDVSGSSR
jgi:hypothetical protein